MGTLLDTSVLIRAERVERVLNLQSDEEVGIAAITAAEMLHGVHRADPEHRVQRTAFVEHVLRAIDTLPFDLATARVHAQIWADLAQQGRTMGPHDLLVAATAVSRGWAVATYNIREFSRVSGLVLRSLPETP